MIDRVVVVEVEVEDWFQSTLTGYTIYSLIYVSTHSSIKFCSIILVFIIKCVLIMIIMMMMTPPTSPYFALGNG